MAAANGSDTLKVRVDALDQDISALGSDLRDLRQRMATREDITQISAQLSALAARQEANAQPRYNLVVSIVGVGITVLALIGGFAYRPISAATDDLKAAVIALSDRAVVQRQYDADQSRLALTLGRLRDDLNITVQQQRYNTDQERLTRTLDTVLAGAEQLRVRTYELHGKISTNERAIHDIDARIDAISRRLAEFIRDTGRR